MDVQKLKGFLDNFWDQEILPAIQTFITIPNESPSFDPQWQANGHMDKAVKLVTDWVEAQKVPGLTWRVVQEGKRTPLLFMELPGTIPDTVLIYGHLDKQPPMEGWNPGLGPWKPVLDDQGRLYGRGGADDGYSVFAAVAFAQALKKMNQPHPRLVFVIECSEESGSPDLPSYLKTLANDIGTPSLVICLDSGCGNYDQLWSTTSLRGMVAGSLKVEVLSEGVHSGISGGIVPNPFRIARQLLDRLEDPQTGRIIPPGLHVEIPQQKVEQAHKTASVLGGAISGDFPFLEGVAPEADDLTELLLASTWRPILAITGQSGLPEADKAGNVLLPGVKLRFSVRIPPTLSPPQASAIIRETLTANPPYGAKVTVTAGGAPGWNAPNLAPWLEEATNQASLTHFGREACYFGIGGSIPFMHMMGEKFPQAQFLITGVLGPHSNAHGPNEFLHVPYAKKLTAAITQIVCAHYTHFSKG